MAWHVGSILEEEAKQFTQFVVRKEKTNFGLKPNAEIIICDFETVEIENLNLMLSLKSNPIDGILHSIAYANYSKACVFHETNLGLPTGNSHFFIFLIQPLNACKTVLNDNASATIGISSIDVTAENYGYMHQ